MTYTDAYLERWGEVFVRLALHRRLGITFLQFLADPGCYLRQVPTHPLRRPHEQPPKTSQRLTAGSLR